MQEGEYENESEFGDDLMEDTEEEEEERIVRYSWDNVEYMSMPDMDEPFERTPPPVTPPPETSPPTASPRRGTATRKDSERTIEDERRTCTLVPLSSVMLLLAGHHPPFS